MRTSRRRTVRRSCRSSPSPQRGRSRSTFCGKAQRRSSCSNPQRLFPRLRPNKGGLIAAQAGVDGTALDQPAFMALVEPVMPTAFRLAVAMLHSDVDAEDAVQEAVYKAWRHRGRFRSGSPMRPWLLAIVANECRAVRRSRWWSVMRLPDGTLRATDDEADPSPESASLRRAIRALPHH